MFSISTEEANVDLGVHCDILAAADSTADNGVGAEKNSGTALSYGDFSDSERKILEETGTKQEFQAEVSTQSLFFANFNNKVYHPM